MPKPTGPTNLEMRKLIDDIRVKGFKDKSDFLIMLAKKLETPERKRAEINLSRINRNASEGETVVIPGKVLSSGIVTKKLTIAAWKFTKAAEQKIKKSGGKMITINELVSKNPKGTNVRMMI